MGIEYHYNLINNDSISLSMRIGMLATLYVKPLKTTKSLEFNSNFRYANSLKIFQVCCKTYKLRVPTKIRRIPLIQRGHGPGLYNSHLTNNYY